MNGFSLQRCRVHDKEEMSIMQFCILNKVPYKLCLRPEDSPEGYAPVGTVEWCENFIPKEKTVPNYYPDFLKDHFHRKIWRADKWPMSPGIFIKPADKHKRFNGRVTLGGYKKKKKGPYWCSEVVEFTNEWRYYIADSKVLIAEWYSGDEVNEPDPPELNINFPLNFCAALDFGTLSTGELALVEANSPYACGWYGKDHKLYAEWLYKGWQSLQ